MSPRHLGGDEIDRSPKIETRGVEVDVERRMVIELDNLTPDRARHEERISDEAPAVPDSDPHHTVGPEMDSDHPVGTGVGRATWSGDGNRRAIGDPAHDGDGSAHLRERSAHQLLMVREAVGTQQNHQFGPKPGLTGQGGDLGAGGKRRSAERDRRDARLDP